MRTDRRGIRVLTRRRTTPLKDIDDVFRVAVARLENRGQARNADLTPVLDRAKAPLKRSPT